MTQENKELLLRDLSARLPYVILMGNKEWKRNPYQLTPNEWEYAMMTDDWDDAPYLRPMSSMTEEEREEYLHISLCDVIDCEAWNEVDWLNSHHFDYRGLIEKGLAIEAPEGMYK